jgi:hypothetical protein
LLLSPPSLKTLSAATAKERRAFQKEIVDYRWRLNPRFKKVKRKRTRYIIVHTSEGNLRSTLRTVSEGKRVHNGKRTRGGHANYVIARNGRTYRILDKKYRANHAGRSMWNGLTDISSVSVGIEMVGYHYAPLTSRQYRSVGILIDILQRVYNLHDKDVLTHGQIAYGGPNRWFKRNHRGRKRCAKNFSRAKAGLGPTWSHDPDVKARRLSADPHLAAIFYGGKQSAASSEPRYSNVISKSNSAWAIAGGDYDSPTTAYKFPDGRVLTGDQIEAKIGWNRIPPRTVILLNQENVGELARQKGPVKTITKGLSAWSFAGSDYNSRSTIYFLPYGKIKHGRMIEDWDDLPEKTRLIVGYRGPYRIGKNRYASQIAGSKYKDSKTLYYFPSKKFIPGNRIADFSRLPAGTLVFVPRG